VSLRHPVRSSTSNIAMCACVHERERESEGERERGRERARERERERGREREKERERERERMREREREKERERERVSVQDLVLGTFLNVPECAYICIYMCIQPFFLFHQASFERTYPKFTFRNVQHIAFGVSFHLIVQSQSPCSFCNRT